MFQCLNLCTEGVYGVIWVHIHGFLEDDAPLIVLIVHKMYGDTADFYAASKNGFMNMVAEKALSSERGRRAG